MRSGAGGEAGGSGGGAVRVEWGGGGRTSRGVMERLRAGLNGSEWVGWSYVFYPVTPGTSGRCRGGKERPARPPPASSHESHVLDNAPAAAREPPPPSSGPQVSAAAFPRRGGGSAAWVLPSRVGGAEAGRARGAGGGGQGGEVGNVGEPAPGK